MWGDDLRVTTQKLEIENHIPHLGTGSESIDKRIVLAQP